MCAAAVKEEQIEVKLAGVAGEWALQELHFQDYKTRGPVILKVLPPFLPCPAPSSTPETRVRVSAQERPPEVSCTYNHPHSSIRACAPCLTLRTPHL